MQVPQGCTFICWVRPTETHEGVMGYEWGIRWSWDSRTLGGNEETELAAIGAIVRALS